MSYKIQRHRVFISFHNADDYYKRVLIGMKEYNCDTCQMQSIFEDYSVGDGDIDDTYLSDEQIRKIIRDEYIKTATVLVLLCGEKTKNRKFIDWELHAAMFNTENNPKLGILVINLPTIEGKQCVRVGQDDEKNLIPSNRNWFSIKTRAGYEESYPYLPSRIIDNLESALSDNTIVPITVIDWSTISNNPASLKTLIDNAYNRSRSKNVHYNHSTPLRRRNS